MTKSNVLEDDFVVDGRYFILNIALPKTDPQTGLTRPEYQRDPRWHRIKPAVYKGIVEDIGDLCAHIKKGDTAFVERWDYLQINVDEERILVSEKDLVIVNSKPLPGISLLGLIEDQKPKSNLLNMDTVEEKEKEYYFGQILASGGTFKKSEYLWINKLDRDQWKLLPGVLVFREHEDCLMMKAQPEKNELIKEDLDV